MPMPSIADTPPRCSVLHTFTQVKVRRRVRQINGSVSAAAALAAPTSVTTCPKATSEVKVVPAQSRITTVPRYKPANTTPIQAASVYCDWNGALSRCATRG